MSENRKVYCSECGAEISSGDRFCPACGATIRRNGWEIKVVGVNHEQVLDVAKSLADDMSKRPTYRNPWISGSFYLAVMVIVVTLFLVAAKTVHIVVLPTVIIGALLMVSIIGAFQLRQDESLSEKNFLTLMFLTFKQFPFIRKKDSTKKNSR